MSLFDKILSGQVECNKVYEDKDTFAFHDQKPQAPIHVLIIPKKKIVSVASSVDEEALVMGKILCTARKVAEQLGIRDSGFRLVFNNNEHGGQTINYLHCHLLGGRQMNWPPG